MDGAPPLPLDCNWKVFVDNYLDGGYHVPHLHKAGQRPRLQRLHDRERRALLPAVEPARHGWRRDGDRRRPPRRSGALLLDLPEFRDQHCYGDAMDTNLVVPLGA